MTLHDIFWFVFKVLGAIAIFYVAIMIAFFALSGLAFKFFIRNLSKRGGI